MGTMSSGHSSADAHVCTKLAQAHAREYPSMDEGG